MSDHEWYKDAVVYQAHVKAFYDSDADGVGDFAGLTQKLDYLADLGVTAIWILPFYPSPLRDDGYDIANYTDVHPAYGTLADFRTFLREAHRRGLRVITELVLNHTSDQHPWFQRARRAKKGSRERDFYVWSDTPERYADVRIIFKDFERSNWTWDHEAGQYYWHRFYAHQPDLNFDNPEVRKAVMGALDFWLKMGVDGFRLDAVPYLYEREGTNCENLPETHAFLRALRQHVDARYGNRMLLAEANMWPDEAVQYFGQGDECHMAFHFPVMPRLFMALQMEDRFPLIDILQQTPPIPPGCQWAIFLRNHDELTLEMVTDEDRDYMYRVYAADPQARINLGIRRRLAPLMGNNRRRIELMNGLLFSLPGTPIIYYGDEIGMGDNIYLGDRNGVRTPMQWSSDRNAGFSRANPQRLYFPVIIDPEYHYEALNVEAQQNNPQSLLWWTKRLIDLRRRHTAFGRGSIEFLAPENHRVLAFIREHEDERILVVANLSRFAQSVELDLRSRQGLVPVEMFGRTPFPPIGELPYFITLGPHAFYWFTLERSAVTARMPRGERVPELHAKARWEELLEPVGREQLEAVLPGYLAGARWFRSKAREITQVEIADCIPANFDGFEAIICLVRVSYLHTDHELYVLPLTLISGQEARDFQAVHPWAVVAELTVDAWKTRAGGLPHLLVDAVWVEGFARAMLDGVSRRRRWRGEAGEIVASRTRAAATVIAAEPDDLKPVVLRGEQSNTSIVFGDRALLKIIRKLDAGRNPELEIGRYLTEGARFRHTPRLLGALEYYRGKGEPSTLGVLHAFVPSEGDAWNYTLHVLGQLFDRVLTEFRAVEPPAPPADPPALMVGQAVPEEVEALLAAQLEQGRLLGRRTAEMHLALASATDDPAFAPEPITPFYRRSLFESFRTQTRTSLELLRKRTAKLPAAQREPAHRVTDAEPEILKRVRSILDRRIRAARIRIHGDYHLGQVLYTGRDFVILDFEGEPARAISERRLKRSPLRDVAGMLRSYEYAGAYATQHGPVRPEDVPVLRPWARWWSYWMSVAFLEGYLECAETGGFLPTNREDLAALLEFYLLDKAMYELRYELNNRPDWVGIALEGILEHLPREVPV